MALVLLVSEVSSRRKALSLALAHEGHSVRQFSDTMQAWAVTALGEDRRDDDFSHSVAIVDPSLVEHWIVLHRVPGWNVGLLIEEVQAILIVRPSDGLTEAAHTALVVSIDHVPPVREARDQEQRR